MRAFVAAVLLAVAFVTPAHARHWHHHHHYRHAVRVEPERGFFEQIFGARAARSDPRPREWCAWWLRQKLGIPMGKINNLALSFLNYGRRAEAEIGAVVIWSHGHGHGHVGQITGPQCGRGAWMVTSGNDGHAVRTRCRYVGNAVGFRI